MQLAEPKLSASPDPAHLAREAERLATLRADLAGSLAARHGLVLEIGSGHGHFLTAYAAAHPERPCVGVDMKAARVARCERKRQRAAADNLEFFRAEARMFMAALPESATLSVIFVLFPDPWPKRRHHKHRLLDENFLRMMAQRSESGAQFCFRTDYEPYFCEVWQLLSEQPDWRLAPEEPWPFELATIFQQRANQHFSLVARRY